VSLSLGKDHAVTLSRAAVVATLNDRGDVRATLTGTVADVPLSMTFDASADAQEIALTGEALPWVPTLLAPTLGETARSLRSASGELKLRTGAAPSGTDHNWTLLTDATLSLTRLPASLGLGDLSGDLRVHLVAAGRLHEAASCSAELSMPGGTEGRASDEALRNLHYLFTGNDGIAGEAETVHAFTGVNLWLLVAPGKYVGVSGTDTDRPVGLFAPAGSDQADGKNLLPLPAVDFIPLRDFQDRLDVLRLRWQREHTS